ncbi:HugZ family pyridoxamine 5'-phosphate oxidase [Amorphus sp. MBR-141]
MASETAPDFDARTTARHLLRTAFQAALGTLEPDGGAPHVSLVTVATLPDGAPVLLLSDLAVHTRNLKADDRVSLMISEPVRPGDPLALARVTLAGRIARTDDPVARRRFLARHPDAAAYAAFPDFGVYRIAPERAHLVAGFGRIVTLPAAELMTDVSGADDLLASEDGAIAHMNQDHADALSLYATRLAGAPDGDWRACGIDPEGIDLVAGHEAARVDFPEPVAPGGSLRTVLVELARRARAVADGVSEGDR